MNEGLYSTNCSSALNLRNAPNPLPARRLQQVLEVNIMKLVVTTNPAV
jgi:hypothetical protein